MFNAARSIFHGSDVKAGLVVATPAIALAVAANAQDRLGDDPSIKGLKKNLPEVASASGCIIAAALCFTQRGGRGALLATMAAPVIATAATARNPDGSYNLSNDLEDITKQAITGLGFWAASRFVIKGMRWANRSGN